jgi:hypothetical protein
MQTLNPEFVPNKGTRLKVYPQANTSSILSNSISDGALIKKARSIAPESKIKIGHDQTDIPVSPERQNY